MRSEHGELKNMECTEHEACRTKEPRKHDNASTLQEHMNSVKPKSDIKAKGKQPCGHNDRRGGTEQYAQEQLEHYRKLYHGELRTLYCTQHDRCKSKSNPRSCNTYGLSNHLKSVERDRKALLNALRCSPPDCSGNADLCSKRQMKLHCKSEHGQPKDLRCSQHLSCNYKTTDIESSDVDQKQCDRHLKEHKGNDTSDIESSYVDQNQFDQHLKEHNQYLQQENTRHLRRQDRASMTIKAMEDGVQVRKNAIRVTKKGAFRNTMRTHSHYTREPWEIAIGERVLALHEGVLILNVIALKESWSGR